MQLNLTRHIPLVLSMVWIAGVSRAQDALRELRAVDPELRLVAGHDGSSLSALRGHLSAPSYLDPRTIAEEFLVDHGELLGIRDVGGELAPDPKRTRTAAETGWTTVAFDQHLRGIPVRDARLRVHVDGDGRVRAVHGRVVPGLDGSLLPAAPTLSPEEAILLPYLRGELAELPLPMGVGRIVVEPVTGEPRLAYEYLVRLEGRVQRVVVDALQGELLVLEVAEAHSSGSSISYYKATTGWGEDHFGNSFLLDLADLKSSTGVTYYTNRLVDITRAGRITGYDDGTGAIIDDSNGKYTASVKEEESAGHRNLGRTLDYFEIVHGRESFDDDGGEMRAYYGATFGSSNSPNNATGVGLEGYSEIRFGDGDGAVNRSFTSLDVVAHEFTHTMLHSLGISSSAHAQADALHESLADTFGVFAESYMGNTSGTWNYEIGEEVKLNAGAEIRDLDNPPANRDHLFDYDSSSSPHRNGQIASYAMVLMAKGTKHPESGGLASNIYWSRIREIYYKAIVDYLDSSPTYFELREALVDAATELYGSSSDEVSAVRHAFNAIGVTDTEFNLLYLSDDFDVWKAYDPSEQNIQFGVLNGMGAAYLTNRILENGNMSSKVLAVNPPSSGFKLVTSRFQVLLGPTYTHLGLAPKLRVKAGFAAVAPSTSAANVWVTFTPSDGTASTLKSIDIVKDGSMDFVEIDLSTHGGQPGTLYVNVRDTGANSGAVFFSELRIVHD